MLRRIIIAWLWNNTCVKQKKDNKIESESGDGGNEMK